MDQPLDDVLDEARRVVARAEDSGLRVRLLGGAAFGLHQHDPVPDALRRTYGDLDVVVGSRHGRELPGLLASLGYEGDQRFNALHGERRMLFRDPLHERRFDVFVGDFTMCHRLALEGRLPEGCETLGVTDLALTKLQIVELNEKDALDVIILLADHEVGTSEADDAVDVGRIAKICGDDWGWHTTVGDNLSRLAATASSRMERNPAIRVAERIQRIQSAIQAQPKSRSWRVRARIGRRMEWFEIPEEVG